jgi:hypothetical protein
VADLDECVEAVTASPASSPDFDNRESRISDDCIRPET